MTLSPLKRSPLVNLKQYTLTLTTAYEPNFGISGHLFEMIEYFMHLRFVKNINTCILMSDGTSEHMFFAALVDKYELTDEELSEFKIHTHFKYQPLVIMANTILVVNGSLRMKGADVLATKKLLFRCSNLEPGLERSDWIVLQDDNIYEPLSNSVHYKKKILFDKYKQFDTTAPLVGMFYAKSNSKVMSTEELNSLVKKYNDHFDKFLLLTDKPMDVPPKVDVRVVPIANLWNAFDTYIYTHATSATLVDCSPRFVAECNFYNKNVKIESPTIDKGLAVRMHDIDHGDVWLRATDDISSKI